MRQEGFTLIELIMVMGILSVVMVMSLGILINTQNVWDAEKSYMALNTALRDSSWQISEELSVAALNNHESMDPIVEGLSIEGDPPSSITFQKPLVSDQTEWSGAITIRLRNEDMDDDLILDSGEDVDGNGVLDRVVERLEDLDGSGDFEGPGETRVLARNMDSMIFQLVDEELIVSLVARSVGKRQKHYYEYSQSFRVKPIE